MAGGRWAKATTHMLVASGMGASRATRAMPSMPGVGSSRYSSTPSMSRATVADVSVVHTAFGSRRSGWPGKAPRSARIASASCSGGKTPPFSFSAVKPYSSTMRRAWATIPSGSSASPQPSGSAPGCAAHL